MVALHFLLYATFISFKMRTKDKLQGSAVNRVLIQSGVSQLRKTRKLRRGLKLKDSKRTLGSDHKSHKNIQSSAQPELQANYC